MRRSESTCRYPPRPVEDVEASSREAGGSAPGSDAGVSSTDASVSFTMEKVRAGSSMSTTTTTIVVPASPR